MHVCFLVMCVYTLCQHIRDRFLLDRYADGLWAHDMNKFSLCGLWAHDVTR